MKWIDAMRDGTQGSSERGARIDRDIDEEFAFHLARLEDELRAEGVAEAELQELTRKRFGDQMRLHEECKAIALKELNMLKKIHLSVTVLLVVAVIGVALFAWQARHAMAIEREAAMMHAESARHERDRAQAVTQFLTSMLTQSDPETPNMVDLATVLREAESRLGVTFDDNPELEAKLREAIEAAKANQPEKQH